MEIKHIHHIIPKHMGGTNDPSNLITLTLEEHAEAHRVLFEKHGLEEDRIAWLGLSKQVSLSEASQLALEEGRRKGGRVGKGGKIGGRVTGEKHRMAWKSYREGTGPLPWSIVVTDNTGKHLKIKYKCDCGMITNASGLKRHQLKTLHTGITQI
jgi:hypothetical protein